MARLCLFPALASLLPVGSAQVHVTKQRTMDVTALSTSIRIPGHEYRRFIFLVQAEAAPILFQEDKMTLNALHTTGDSGKKIFRIIRSSDLCLLWLDMVI